MAQFATAEVVTVSPEALSAIAVRVRVRRVRAWECGVPLAHVLCLTMLYEFVPGLAPKLPTCAVPTLGDLDYLLPTRDDLELIVLSCYMARDCLGGPDYMAGVALREEGLAGACAALADIIIAAEAARMMRGASDRHGARA